VASSVVSQAVVCLGAMVDAESLVAAEVVASLVARPIALLVPVVVSVVSFQADAEIRKVPAALIVATTTVKLP
jgi:hypothetical protein